MITEDFLEHPTKLIVRVYRDEIQVGKPALIDTERLQDLMDRSNRGFSENPDRQLGGPKLPAVIEQPRRRRG